MEWQFDELNSGSIEGWNHPGLAQFRSGALSNLVRETLQNSLDNPHPDNGDETPIIVRFLEHSVDRENVPGIDDLQKTLKDCLKQVDASNEEVRKGIKSALELAQSQKIKVLEIADYHTTGMPGPAIRRQPFHNYLKTSGDSTADTSRGGSHGLGKFAPLVNTELRTIFVSTKWEEDGAEKSLFQGLSFMLGREMPDGKTLGQKGYLGGPDFQPLEKIPEEFSWMERTTTGTSLFLVGWDSPERWEMSVIGHALISYFAAFQRKKLIISVRRANTKEVSVGSDGDFRDFFVGTTTSQNIKSVLDQAGQGYGEQFVNSLFYLRCLEDDGVTEYKTQINPGINASRVLLLKDDDAPQRIAFIRNNIFITDQIPTFFKQRSQQFNNYAGVFEVENEPGYQLLRRMENPSHTELNADWLPVTERRGGKSSLRALGQKLKDIVKENMKIGGDVDTGPIEILKEFFSDEGGEGADNIENEDINPTGLFKISSRPPKFAPPPVISIDDQEEDEEEIIAEEEGHGTDGGSGTEGGGGGGGVDGHGDGEGDGTGGTGNKGSRDPEKNKDNIKLSNKRVIGIENETVTATITVEKAAKALITLQEVGADFSEDLSIKNCNEGSVTDKGVLIEFEAGKPLKLQFECEKEVVGGIKLLVRGSL
ncbi:hypothetical protein N9L35_02230 [Alphaproteobacteria bacterium]|nr:hypothetical protein [Alphaproteobacteria bacterium]